MSFGSSTLGLAVWAILCGFQCLWAQGRSSSQWNLLIVSIDTLRADHLGAYGYAPSVTPNLDRLAREGAVFEQVFTPVPLTLPAHASLLTGAYPPAHGIRDNGEALPASVPTLAEHLRSRGFQTAAFVGAFVLDRRFGLSRGFDEYWGEFPLHRFGGADPGTIQIRGDAVEAAAERWITTHASARFFALVHFFDLHGPYLLPRPWRARFPNRVYDGELAYVDDLIGRLWKTLQGLGVADRTLLVITADHGEGLGDHGERNHGFLLYRSTTHVPLLLRFPDGRWTGRRIKSVASLIDLPATVCSIFELPSLPSSQGRSLTQEFAGQAPQPRPAYSETLYPNRHFHAAPLYSLRDEQYSLMQAPRPELYDMRADPRETRNLFATNRAVAGSRQRQLSALMAAMGRGPEAVPVSPQLAERLKSLGYVSASSGTSRLPSAGQSLPDPKDQIALYRQFQDALALATQGNTRAAVSRLEQILVTDPALFSVRIEAGLARQTLGEDALAVKHFEEALRLDPQSALAHNDLGVSLGNLRRDREAERELDLATQLQPWFSRAHTARGLAQARLGNLQGALLSFDRAISIDTNDFDAWLNRGNVRGSLGQWDKARLDMERAAALEPKSAAAHEALGTLSFHLGDLNRALQEYQLAVSLQPNSSSAHSSLGLLYKRMGRTAEARVAFQRALALDPNNAEAREGLQ